MFSWHDAAEQRHAIDLAVYPLPPRPDERVTTLCGAEITLTRQDFPQLAEYKRYKKTCLDCDAVWRTRANLKPRPVPAR
jgi:hypothetical protein